MALENFKKLVTNVTSTTVKKAGEQVKITKLELEKNRVEKEIEDIYAEIGRYCYAKRKEGLALDDAVAEYCGEIDTLANQIAEITNRIDAHRVARDAAEYDLSFGGDSSDIEVEIVEMPEDADAAEETAEDAADAAAEAEAEADAAAEEAPEGVFDDEPASPEEE